MPTQNVLIFVLNVVHRAQSIIIIIKIKENNLVTNLCCFHQWFTRFFSLEQLTTLFWLSLTNCHRKVHNNKIKFISKQFKRRRGIHSKHLIIIWVILLFYASPMNSFRLSNTVVQYLGKRKKPFFLSYFLSCVCFVKTSLWKSGKETV